MARSIGFEQFSRRMTIVADVVDKNAGKVIRQAALEADQVGVLRTPVDTGRARANWIVSTGSPSSTETAGPNAGDQSANEAQATAQALNQAQTALVGYKLTLGPIFITNNVEYIMFLDEGSSEQAPQGMTAFMLQAASDVLRKGGLLKGLR
jgi:hypothetical protein